MISTVFVGHTLSSFWTDNLIKNHYDYSFHYCYGSGSPAKMAYISVSYCIPDWAKSPSLGKPQTVPQKTVPGLQVSHRLSRNHGVSTIMVHLNHSGPIRPVVEGWIPRNQALPPTMGWVCDMYARDADQPKPTATCTRVTGMASRPERLPQSLPDLPTSLTRPNRHRQSIMAMNSNIMLPPSATQQLPDIRSAHVR